MIDTKYCPYTELGLLRVKLVGVSSRQGILLGIKTFQVKIYTHLIDN